ncbi:MAG TPA: metallophosphoesterase [Terracidiphilus sp.]|nr:metallophosphoesterase [Terracidiphilus sp.]
MNHRPLFRGAAVCAALLSVLSLAGNPATIDAQPAPKTVKALMVSDIHFDPFCDSAKVVEELSKHRYEEWQDILDHAVSKVTKPCILGRLDTSYALLKTSFDYIRTQSSGVAFITVSGDLLAHDFRRKYGRVFHGNGTPEYDELYAVFAEKAANFAIMELNRLAPGVPVYVALGNNDSACDDYGMHRKDEFLTETVKQVTEPVPSSERDKAIDRYTEGGYYSVSLPAPIQNARLLVLEDVYWAGNYKTCGGASDAVEELKWLNQQLADARTNKEAVWVMGHIPTGIDPYGTLYGTGGNCQAIRPRPFLTSDNLFDMIAGGGDVIRLALFAHTHMDEIKLLEPAAGGAAKEPVPTKVLPSISPYNGNNPTFTIAEIDPATATLTNYQVYAADGNTPSATWGMEYDYAKSYGESSFSASSVKHLIARFAGCSSGSTCPSPEYIHHYQAGTRHPYMEAMWSKYVCTEDNNSASGFEDCACPNGR